MERTRNDTPVSTPTTCTEIDECLETHHACGDPALFENPCTDLINGYDCHCGNFTQRGFANNPCDDFRLPHKLHHDSKCTWKNVSANYSCECDDGYFNKLRILLRWSIRFSVFCYEYCHDVDDCRLAPLSSISSAPGIST